MSTPAGHARITRRAVELFAADGHPAGRAPEPHRTARFVVARDVLDLLTLGHWTNAGQRHHFMRRFDGQSEREAYDEAVAWVRSRAAAAARREAGAALVPSQALGDALHAVQDSFAPGHAWRESPHGPLPGAIRSIRRYAGAEKDGHAEADLQWRGDGPDGFSECGWHAIHATRDLLRLIADAAAAADPGAPVRLDGFEAWRRTWLEASADLGRDHGRPIGFLRRLLARAG